MALGNIPEAGGVVLMGKGAASAQHGFGNHRRNIFTAYGADDLLRGLQ